MPAGVALPRLPPAVSGRSHATVDCGDHLAPSCTRCTLGPVGSCGGDCVWRDGGHGCVPIDSARRPDLFGAPGGAALVEAEPAGTLPLTDRALGRWVRNLRSAARPPASSG